MGQGVMCLREAFLTHSSWRARVMSQYRGSGSGSENKSRSNSNSTAVIDHSNGQNRTLTVQLSTGGKKMGCLRLKMRLSRREYSIHKVNSGVNNMDSGVAIE